MASSEDFKRILELYNQESKTCGVSIVAFCQKNGIVYSQFEHWYKNRHKVFLSESIIKKCHDI